MTPEARRIVVLGGGFGWVHAARALEKLFLRDDAVEIVLISEEKFLLFTPMLPEVASGSLAAKHIISPIRAFFRKAQFHNSEVQRIDLNNRKVFTRHCLACGQYELRFDHLVLALGSTTNFYGLPGVTQYAIPMKSLSDAIVLRDRIIDRFEHANMESDPDMPRVLLTFVVAVRMLFWSAVGLALLVRTPLLVAVLREWVTGLLRTGCKKPAAARTHSESALMADTLPGA